MDRRVTWVGIVLLLCFALLFLQLNNLQVKQATALNNNYLNQHLPGSTSEWKEPRGSIISADGVVLAYTRPSRGANKYYLRVYPHRTAAMFSDITGYYATAAEANPFGIEASYNKLLRQHESPANSLGALLDQHTETDNVYLTISEKLQAVAMQALNSAPVSFGGAIVAIDPRNGDILAMYSNPSYNPNLFSVNSFTKVNALATKLNSRGACDVSKLNPLCNYATEEPEFPGSTMKVITTAAMFDHDPKLQTEKFKYRSSLPFPSSPPLSNYGGESCGGDLALILADSCDTAYAQLGDQLGVESLSAEAHSFGFCVGEGTLSSCGDTSFVPPLDLPNTEPSVFPGASTIAGSAAYLGYSAIGQFDDKATVLQMALVASAIANNGVIMAPHVVTRAVNGYGETEFTYKPHAWLKVTSANTATQVRQLMTGVTRTPGATAYSLFSGWYSVGGPIIAAKTGTAEPLENTCGTYNWLIALGPAGPGQTPTVAVAAMIPVNKTECSTAGYAPTGASVAGPVLLPVLQAALAQQGS